MIPRRVMTAAQIRELRAETGITGHQLAEYLDVSPRTVKYWESGQYPVPRVAALALTSAEVRKDLYVMGGWKPPSTTYPYKRPLKPR